MLEYDLIRTLLPPEADGDPLPRVRIRICIRLGTVHAYCTNPLGNRTPASEGLRLVAGPGPGEGTLCQPVGPLHRRL